MSYFVGLLNVMGTFETGEHTHRLMVAKRMFM
jgi:hypothetical protein